MRKALLLLSILSLSGCGTFQAYKARTQLLGMTEPDLISCMGTPDKIQYISPKQHVLGWDYTQTGTDVDIEFGLYAAKLGRPGVCHVSIRELNGITTSVHYQDADVNPTNPDSVCGRMVEECLRHPEHTPLPANFNPDSIIDGPKK